MVDSFNVSHSTAQLLGLAGFIISLTAVWLQWNLPYRISRLEDMVKDGRISGEVKERRIRRAQLMPMVCTLLGACLLIWAVLRLLQ